MILSLVAGCSSDAAAPASRRAVEHASGASLSPTPAGQAAVAAAPAPPASPDGPTAEVPSTIDHTCGGDVTSELQSLFDGAKDNSTITFPSGGCYRVDDTLTIDGHHRLQIEGNGATLRAGTPGDRNRRHLIISNSDDITVRGLTVIGSNDKPGVYDEKLAFQHAFALNGVHRALLDKVSASRLHGDFVYIGGKVGSPSSDVTVTSSTFDGSGRQGIAVTAADRVLISGNDIANVARSMFDIEPNSPDDEVRDVRITGNRTGKAVNFWLANKGAGDNVGPIELDGNTMTEATGGLIFAFGKANSARGPYAVRDNQLIASDAVHDEGSIGAMFFVQCHDVSIVGNRITFAPGVEMPVIELHSSRSVTVAGNDFSGAPEPILSDSTTTDLSTSS
ncbi:MAG: hypothetical protein QOD92_4325 [Acidimicrobiaceae bacterium]